MDRATTHPQMRAAGIDKQLEQKSEIGLGHLPQRDAS
jgi:hypothetical protein